MTRDERWLNRLERVFGWGWVLLSLLAIYFLVKAVFFHGPWLSAVLVLVVAWICRFTARRLLMIMAARGYKIFH